MKIARNGAERFALRAFAAAGRAEEDERVVFHERKGIIPQTVLKREAQTRSRKKAGRGPAYFSKRPQDRHSLVDRRDRSAHCHRPAQKWCNRGPARRSCPAELRSALANDDVSGHDHLAAKSFYAQSFADAVAAVLNAALSFL